MNEDATSAPDARDLGEQKGGMPLSKLEGMLSDIDHEPKWRESANKCADYYDHKQASAERIERSARTGEPLTIINLIQRTINGALGQEAKTRLNWKADPDAQAFAPWASVLNEKLQETQREAGTDMAISEAYSSMLRTGIGWVEVSRSPDPLAFPYRATPLHRNDVFWDWRARMPDKSDAAWMCRQRWVDLDEAIVTMPEFASMLEIGCHSGPITDSMARAMLTNEGNFQSILDTRRAYSRTEEEWLDNASRRRIRFYSVYYKQYKTAVALVSGTKRIKFNPQNPIHAALVANGAAKLISGPSFVIRHAMFAGPYRLFDVETKTRRYPLVPFVCYSADDDRSPYGLVHGMIEPQDEFNKRRSRLLWMLEAKQVFVDEDALAEKYNTFQTLANEVMRPDAMFVLKKDRTNKDALRIDQNQQLSAEQARVMDDSKVLIQDQPGLFSPQFGSNSIGASSGVALNSLMEQSVGSLGETSDNYRTSRKIVGELLCDLISEDFKEPNQQVEVGTGKRRRVVVLNTMTPEGVPENMVEDSAVKIGLGDVPNTASFRSQQQTFLSNAINSVGNDPVSRAVLVPALIESGDLEHREMYAKWMRKQAGVPEPEDMEQEDPAAEQQAQQQQMQQMELAQRAAIAKIVKDEMAAEREKAAAGKLTAEAQILAGVAPAAPPLMNQQAQMPQDPAAQQAFDQRAEQDAMGQEQADQQAQADEQAAYEESMINEAMAEATA